MHPKHFRELVKYNVLTTSEAAEILEMTRQGVNNLVKEKKISPLKTSSQGLLFLRSDVETLKNNKSPNPMQKSVRKPIYFDYSGSTQKSLMEFQKHKNKLKTIRSIHIYFNELDAINDGFYLPSDIYRYGDLISLDNPHFILIDSVGNELWLGGCNCGYGGAGPHGSKEILSELGLSYDLIEPVFKYRVVKYFNDLQEDSKGAKWDVIARSESVDSFDSDSGYARFYLFRNNIVLVQDFHRHADSEKILKKYRAFIPNPIEALIFNSDEQAKEYGYFALDTNGSEIKFRCVIKDCSGKELWLRPFIDTGEPLQKQFAIIKILERCGFELKQQNLTDKVTHWVNKLVIKNSPGPYRINRD